MPRASLEQALTGLIPTLNGPLPSELEELAQSLLARSRSVAHSLKPDEEIARPYACAQLACDRLKKQLNLPAITSRPPCPPRVYKKLYTYLESALPAAVSQGPETPRKPRSQAPSARTTPKTPLSTRKTPRSALKRDRESDAPPEWVMPAIRALARALASPSTIPHVYTGVESTLPLLARMSAASVPETPSKRPRRAATKAQPPPGELSIARTLALIAVMFFFVLSSMGDRDITREQYLKWRAEAVSTLLDLEASQGVTEAELVEEIEILMPMAREEGWLNMDWFQNIVPLAQSEEMEGVEVSASQSTRPSANLKDSLTSDYIGLGTMMQDATDYLGSRQMEDYKRWEAGILAKLEEIESS